MSEVDLVPLLDLVGEFAYVVLSLLATYAVKKIGDFLGADVDEKYTRQLNQLIDEGIEYGKKRVKGDDDQLALDMNGQSMVITEGLNYLAENAPKILKRMKIDPYSEKGRARIENWIEARIG